ncbi:MAG: SpoIIE family protein phosphatase [Bacteroidota bacterium]
MKLSRLVFIFFPFFAFQLNAQKLNLQKNSFKEGLSQSTVKQIEKDLFGNLWLATDYGLSKFNGKSFEIYTTANGLPDDNISCLLFYKNTLFIGTHKGLTLFDGNSIRTISNLQKIKGVVKKIVAKNNYIHVLTTRGYYVLDHSTNYFKIDSIAVPSIISNNPTDAKFDEDGNLWIGTSKNGLYFIEYNTSTKIQRLTLVNNTSSSTKINNKPIRIVNFNSSNLLKSDQINSIEFDAKQNLLLSDWGNGLALIKLDISNKKLEATYLKLDSVLPNNTKILRYTNIYKDNKNQIHLATDGLGYFIIPFDLNTHENDYYNKNIKIINKNNGFYGNNPLCFLNDEYENEWIGTLNDGLISISENNSINYGQKNGLLEENIVSMFQSSDHSIWLGTYGGGAFKFKDKNFSRCFWEDGISESIVKSIIEDNHGNIWLGTVGGGISIISKDNLSDKLLVSKVISKSDGLRSNFINYLYKDKNGAIWVGYESQNGIDKIVFNKDFTYTISNYLIARISNFTVNSIIEDLDKKIWISSNEGVWIFNTKNNKIENEYNNYKNIRCSYLDWNGNVWLGSSDEGIIILKNKIHSRYFDDNDRLAAEKINTSKGLNSNCVNTILFSDKKIWAITNNGLNELKIDLYFSKILELKVLLEGKGFPSYDNKPNNALLTENKDIYIGSIEGLNVYPESSKQKNIKIPLETFINKLLINNNAIDWTNKNIFETREYSSIKFGGYYNWFKIPKNLELDYKHNSVSFLLNTNSILNQKQIHYSFKLMGFDKKSNTLTNSNEIIYRNLPPGDFILSYKASLTNDFSKAKEYFYLFTINPPFYKTNLFYSIIFIAILSILYYFIFTRQKKLKREKLKLELLVKSRTADIEKKSIEIELQNNIIQEINKDLTDSITYAQRIQRTIFPDLNILNNYFADKFVYYNPRNIVSGDYYWVKEIKDSIYVAAVDCTGHGVPGAFMSLITNNILNQAAESEISSYSPSKMLDYLRRKINIKLNQNNNEQINDGLDIALLRYDKKTGVINYANANRPLYIISNNELTILPSDNIIIGGLADFRKVIPFKTLKLNKGDKIFLFTDGITDQFGGSKNKKYNPQRLRQFLLNNHHLPFSDLKIKLENEIKDWKGPYEQTDDILLLGLLI